MTLLAKHPRGLAVALFGLVQLGFAAGARAVLLRRTIDRRADRDRAWRRLRPAGVRGVLRLVGAGEPRRHREHAVRGECSRDLPRRPQPLLQSQHQRCRPHPTGRLDEDLYVSYRNNRNRAWGVPTPLASINTGGFNERNAALSRDGSMLFFSSNRTPSVGLLDLYVSRRTSKNKRAPDAWSAPVNLGAVVNSAATTSALATSRTRGAMTSSTSPAPDLAAPGSWTSMRAPAGPTGEPFGAPVAGGRAERPEQRCASRRSARTVSRSCCNPTACRPPASGTSGWRPAQTLSEPWGYR